MAVSLSDIFTSIANAIRTKRGQSSSTKYKPEDMAAGILAISTGTDVSDTTAVAGDVRNGKYFYTSSGTKTQGTLSPGTDVSDTTASASDVKSGKYFYNSSGVKTSGSMNSYTDTTQYLNAGQIYNISNGFHGGGSVIANSLSSQTQATAEASDIKSGKTAWVNGTKVTGTYDIIYDFLNTYSEVFPYTATEEKTINLGFRPSFLMCTVPKYNRFAVIYDASQYSNKYYDCKTKTWKDITGSFASGVDGVICSITSTGFSISLNTGSDGYEMVYACAK